MNKKYLTQRKNQILSQIHTIEPFIQGTLNQIRRVCGAKNCKCSKGQKHLGWYLTWKEDRKTKTIYVPKGRIEEVKKWIKEYNRLKRLILEMSFVQRQSLKTIKNNHKGGDKWQRSY
jgi:hypothetical protein